VFCPFLITPSVFSTVYSTNGITDLFINPLELRPHEFKNKPVVRCIYGKATECYQVTNRNNIILYWFEILILQLFDLNLWSKCVYLEIYLNYKIIIVLFFLSKLIQRHSLYWLEYKFSTEKQHIIVYNTCISVYFFRKQVV
jgi:hypothetical protein